ncbi:unnamed protein product [Urochloa humidicola]
MLLASSSRTATSSFFVWPSSRDGGFGDEFDDSTCSLPKYTGIPTGSAIERVDIATAADPLLPIWDNSREDLGLNGCWRTCFGSPSTDANPSSQSQISALIINPQGPLLFQLLYYCCFVLLFVN